MYYAAGTSVTLTPVGTQIRSDDIIGDLLRQNMTLLLFAIDPFPFGRLGSLARTFLFGTSAHTPQTASLTPFTAQCNRNASPDHNISQPHPPPEFTLLTPTTRVVITTPPLLLW